MIPQDRMNQNIALTDRAPPRLSLIPTTSTIDPSEPAPPPYTKTPSADDPPSEALPGYPARRFLGLKYGVWIGIAAALVALGAIAGLIIGYARISSSLSTPAPPSTNATIADSGFRYLGCYADLQNSTSTLQRTLNGTETDIQSSNNAVACASICHGWNYFGLENTSLCLCAQQLLSIAQPVNQSSCNAACPGGVAGVSCGGATFISIYQALNITTG